MMNTLGKGLALTQVALSIVLMGLALAMYLYGVDFGWNEPARYWRDIPGKTKKGDARLIPSQIDKRQAAMQQLVRVREGQEKKLVNYQEKLANLGTVLGDNHLQGLALLAKLENGPGQFPIYHVKIDAKGELVQTPPETGFPAFSDTAIPGINMSYAGYQAKLKDVDARTSAVHLSTGELLKKNEVVTMRLNGEKGARPGWYALLETEYGTQQALLKEIDWIQPLWVKERVDAELVIARRDSLLRRLQELGDKGYLTQSEFLQKGK